MRSLILSIYVRSVDPFFWISNKYMASRSSAKSLSFYFHTGLGHNFNNICCDMTVVVRSFLITSDEEKSRLMRGDMRSCLGRCLGSCLDLV